MTPTPERMEPVVTNEEKYECQPYYDRFGAKLRMYKYDRYGEDPAMRRIGATF